MDDIKNGYNSGIYTEIIRIDDVEYVRADAMKSETVEFTGEETIASRSIGKKVLVRSRNEGINAGIVVLADETGIELKNVRRLYYYRPKDSSTSWYEGVAMTGLHSDSKVSSTVDSKIIIEDYSIIECTELAFGSIMGMNPNES